MRADELRRPGPGLQKLETLLEELSFVPGLAFVRDVSYVDFLDRVGRDEQKLRSAGVWDVPHPWLNIFVPRSRILDFDAGVFKGILKGTRPVGLILMYPMNKDRWDDRMTTATPDENAAVLEFCHREGIGYRQYLPSHASLDGWRRHFGEKWSRFAALKRKYDPRAILTPGQGIFFSAGHDLTDQQTGSDSRNVL
jgi:cytokinin dehydrogenase